MVTSWKIKVWQVMLALAVSACLAITGWSVDWQVTHAHGGKVVSSVTTPTASVLLSDQMPQASHPKHRHHHVRWPWGMTPTLMHPVLLVHQCEEPSSWSIDGSNYQGGLGWTPTLWVQIRAAMGRKFRGFPLRAYLATPRAQGRAMLFFIHHVNGDHWPDEVYGLPCHGY